MYYSVLVMLIVDIIKNPIRNLTANVETSTDSKFDNVESRMRRVCHSYSIAGRMSDLCDTVAPR